MSKTLLREFVRQSLLLEGDPPAIPPYGAPYGGGAIEMRPQPEMPPFAQSDLVASLDEFTTACDVFESEIKKALTKAENYTKALAAFDSQYTPDFAVIIDKIQGPLAGPATLDAVDGSRLVKILAAAAEIDHKLELPLPLTIGYACAKITETWDVGNVTEFQTAARRLYNQFAAAGAQVAGLTNTVTTESAVAAIKFLYEFDRGVWAQGDIVRRSMLTPKEREREDKSRASDKMVRQMKKQGQLMQAIYGTEPLSDDEYNKLAALQTGLNDHLDDDDDDVSDKDSGLVAKASTSTRDSWFDNVPWKEETSDTSGSSTGVAGPAIAMAAGGGMRRSAIYDRKPVNKPVETSTLTATEKQLAAEEELAKKFNPENIKPLDQVVHDVQIAIPGTPEGEMVSAAAAKKESTWLITRAFRNSRPYKKVMQTFIRVMGPKAAKSGKVNAYFIPKQTYSAEKMLSRTLPRMAGGAALGIMAASTVTDLQNAYQMPPAMAAGYLASISVEASTAALANLIMDALLGSVLTGVIEILSGIVLLGLAMGFIAGILYLGLIVTDEVSGPLGLWKLSLDKVLFGEESAVQARAEAIAAASPEAMKEVANILIASGYKAQGDKLAAIVPTFTGSKIYRPPVIAAINDFYTSCAQIAPVVRLPGK